MFSRIVWMGEWSNSAVETLAKGERVPLATMDSCGWRVRVKI